MRRESFPGLQSRFFTFLSQAFESTNKFSGLEVIDALNRAQSTFSDEEREFISRSLGNFLTAAKKAGVIESFGKKRGYQLRDRDGDMSRSDDISGKNAKFDAEDRAQHDDSFETLMSESFLHFPATLLLADEFQGQVVSLPAKMEGRKWANPDMLLIYDNRIARSDHREMGNFTWDEQRRLLGMLDNSPQFVVASVELKLGLRSRSDVLNALSETALNGSWANETILVYLSLESDPGDVFDYDALEFARNNGIGIYAMEVDSLEDGTGPILTLTKVLPSRPKAYLEIRSITADTGNGNRQLLQRVLQLTKDYAEKGPILGRAEVETDDYETLGSLIRQALENLEIQRGFKDRNDFCDRLKRASKGDADEATFVRAIANLLPVVIGDGIDMKAKDFRDSIENSSNFSSAQCERVLSVFAALK